MNLVSREESMRRVLVLLGLVLLAGGAAAHADHAEHADGGSNISVSTVVDNPEAVAAVYNNNTADLPSMVTAMVSGERIEVHIENGGEATVIGVVMEGSRIQRVEPGGLQDPTVELFIGTATLEQILASETPAKAAVEAFNGDGIRYDAHGLGSTVKLAILSALSRLAGFLL